MPWFIGAGGEQEGAEIKAGHSTLQCAMVAQSILHVSHEKIY